MPHNPIFEAEYRHQERASVGAPVFALRVVLILALIFSLVLFLGVVFEDLIAVLLLMPPLRIHGFLETLVTNTSAGIGIVLFATQVILIAHALQIASGSIAREKEGRTWESLLLTGIDAHRIVHGKWLASLTTIWRLHRQLLFWRVLVLFVVCCLVLQTSFRAAGFFLLILLAPAF